MTSHVGPTISVRPSIQDVGIVHAYLRRTTGIRREKMSHVINEALALLAAQIISQKQGRPLTTEEAYLELEHLLPISARARRQLATALRMTLTEQPSLLNEEEPPSQEPPTDEVLERLRKAGL